MLMTTHSREALRRVFLLFDIHADDDLLLGVQAISHRLDEPGSEGRLFVMHVRKD
jgi:hypothetical protein